MRYVKKSLGQNFLIDKNIIQKIVKTSSIKNEHIFEIGPGTGNLTKKILEAGPKTFYAVEKDKNLYFDLKNHSFFKDKVFLINKDVLKIDFEKI